MKNITVILVNPQLGENIGMAARAMLNFGFSHLRIINPRDAWPNKAAISAAAHAVSVINNAEIFEDFSQAIADFNYIYAASARKRDLNLEVTSSTALAEEFNEQHQGKKIAILFGQENSGLSNEHITSSNKILTIPVNKNCPSINLANSVGVICYELSKHKLQAFQKKTQLELATRENIDFLCNELEKMLEENNFYQVETKKKVMNRNIKNIFNRIPNFTRNEFNSLMGILNSLHKYKR